MKQFILSEELKNGIVSLFGNVLNSLPELSQPKEPTEQRIPQTLSAGNYTFSSGAVIVQGIQNATRQ